MLYYTPVCVEASACNAVEASVANPKPQKQGSVLPPSLVSEKMNIPYTVKTAFPQIWSVF